MAAHRTTMHCAVSTRLSALTEALADLDTRGAHSPRQLACDRL